MSSKRRQPGNDKLLKATQRKVKNEDRGEGQVAQEPEPWDRKIAEGEKVQTGQKQLEDKLKQSEEKYRSLFELAQDSIMLADSDGVITSFNPAGLKQSGYSEEEIVGRHFTTLPLFCPQDIPRFTGIFNSVMTGKLVEPFEIVFKRKDGELRLGEVCLSLLKVSGQVVGCQAITRDITERKRDDEALRESEAKYSTVVEKGNDGIVILQDSVIKFANSRIGHFIGYSPDEAIGRPLTEFVSPQYRDFALDRYQKRMRGEKVPDKYEIDLLAKSGRTVPVEINASTIEYRGRPADMAIIRDATERRQAEQTIRESEEKYRNLVERANDGIVIIQDGLVKYLNQSLARMCGYTVEQVTGTLFTDYIHPEELPKVVERYRKRMSGEDVPPVYESTLKHKSRDDVYVELNVATISHNGRTAELVLVRDITERKKAEDEHLKSLETLHKAMESTVQALATTLEVRDPYTAGHQQRVTLLACAIAKEMGLPESQIDGIRISGSVHDIGKIYVPHELLSKPGRLNEAEFSMIKLHPKAGHDILKHIEFPWPVAAIVYQHHERMNGSGYPQSLSGHDILLEARIIAIADVVEAVSSHRPYRPALGIGAALESVARDRSNLYDATAVDACLELFNEKDFRFE